MCCSLSSLKELDIITPWFTKPGKNLGIAGHGSHICSCTVSFHSLYQTLLEIIGKGWLMTTEPIHAIVESLFNCQHRFPGMSWCYVI